MGIDRRQSAYVFMLNHAKAVLSAAVRASVMGPYQAQSVLASPGLRELIMRRIEREWETVTEEAGQVVPVLDLWVGRHELLYSRIFNS
jgi:urease accessory protein